MDIQIDVAGIANILRILEVVLAVRNVLSDIGSWRVCLRVHEDVKCVVVKLVDVIGGNSNLSDRHRNVHGGGEDARIEHLGDIDLHGRSRGVKLIVIEYLHASWFSSHLRLDQTACHRS